MRPLTPYNRVLRSTPINRGPKLADNEVSSASDDGTVHAQEGDIGGGGDVGHGNTGGMKRWRTIAKLNILCI